MIEHDRSEEIDQLTHLLKKKDIEKGDIPDSAEKSDAGGTASVHEENQSAHGEESTMDAQVP